MNIRREGILVDSELGTGDILVLELSERDCLELVANRYTMNRFMGLKHGLQTHGWAAEDKVHLWLRDAGQVDKAADSKHPFEISLDDGGDITYTFRRQQLDRETPMLISVGTIEEVVRSDPSEHLKRIGVRSAKVYGAAILAQCIGTEDSGFPGNFDSSLRSY